MTTTSIAGEEGHHAAWAHQPLYIFIFFCASLHFCSGPFLHCASLRRADLEAALPASHSSGVQTQLQAPRIAPRREPNTQGSPKRKSPAPCTLFLAASVLTFRTPNGLALPALPVPQREKEVCKGLVLFAGAILCSHLDTLVGYFSRCWPTCGITEVTNLVSKEKSHI